MSEFSQFVAEMRKLWRLTRFDDNNLTFQEFLLAMFIFQTQEKD